MLKLDKTNLRILEILAQNCRVSHATICRSLRISKDTVAYRIRQLEQAEVIKSYVLFCDVRKLGLTRYHLLIQFESSSLPSNESMMLLAKHPFVMWVNSFIGRFDLQIIVDAHNTFHLERIRTEISKICKIKIKNISVLAHLYDLEFTQLNPVINLKTDFNREDSQAFGSLITRTSFPVGSEFERYPINRSELEILRMLAINPRISISEISEHLKIERITIRRRILEMIKQRLIINFGAIPNLTSLNFVTYYLLIRLSQNTPKSALHKPFKSLKNIFYAGAMLGDYSMIAYLNARSPQELNSSVAKLREDLSPYIDSFDLLVQDKVYHWKQFTDGIYHHLLTEI